MKNKDRKMKSFFFVLQILYFVRFINCQRYQWGLPPFQPVQPFFYTPQYPQIYTSVYYQPNYPPPSYPSFPSHQPQDFNNNQPQVYQQPTNFNPEPQTTIRTAFKPYQNLNTFQSQPTQQSFIPNSRNTQSKGPRISALSKYLFLSYE